MKMIIKDLCTTYQRVAIGPTLYFVKLRSRNRYVQERTEASVHTE